VTNEVEGATPSSILQTTWPYCDIRRFGSSAYARERGKRELTTAKVSSSQDLIPEAMRPGGDWRDSSCKAGLKTVEFERNSNVGSRTDVVLLRLIEKGMPVYVAWIPGP
jgi:hypothetical protein